jgi:hypothetical protein
MPTTFLICYRFTSLPSLWYDLFLQISNIIFVDQPTGTGFSYSSDDRDTRHDETGVSNDLYDFLQVPLLYQILKVVVYLCFLSIIASNSYNVWLHHLSLGSSFFETETKMLSGIRKHNICTLLKERRLTLPLIISEKKYHTHVFKIFFYYFLRINPFY